MALEERGSGLGRRPVYTWESPGGATEQSCCTLEAGAAASDLLLDDKRRLFVMPVSSVSISVGDSRAVIRVGSAAEPAAAASAVLGWHSTIKPSPNSLVALKSFPPCWWQTLVPSAASMWQRRQPPLPAASPWRWPR